MGFNADAIHVQTLGGFRVISRGRERHEVRGQPVRAALLVYLAIEREATRDTLVGMFWPDMSEGRARHALSQALHKLRRDLAEDWVRAEGEALLATPRVEVDAHVFEQAVAAGDHRAALDLYAGHFLEGWRLLDTHALELWVDGERSRLERLFSTAAREHVRRCGAAGELEAAVAAARRWVQVTPLNDEAHAALIEVLVLSSRRSEAARQYEELGRRLAADGLAPASAVIERIERVLARRDPRLSGDRATARDCVLVLPFENRTGRHDLDPLGRMAADWIVEGLDRTGMARIVPVLDALLAVQGGPDPSDGEASRVLELARASRAGTVACGSYYDVDGVLEIRAQVVDTESGELRGTIEPVRVRPDETARAVALLRERVLGLLAATLAKDWAGLPIPSELGVRPPTYEAYRAYARGLEHFLAAEYAVAVPEFERAIDLDPSFTRPMFLAAAALGNVGEWERVGPLLARLGAIADRLSPYEIGSLRWHQAMLAGDREAAHAASCAGWRRYPGTMAHFVAGLDALAVNRPRIALEICRSQDPDHGWLRGMPRYWEVLTAAHHMLGEHDLERRAAGRARRSFPALLSALAWEARALAAAGQVDALAGCLRAADDLPPQPGWSPAGVTLVAVAELRAHGHPAAADAWVERALERLRSASGAGPLAARSRSDLAAGLYAAGRWEQAASLFGRLSEEFPQNLDFRGRLGVLAARAGRMQQAADVQWQVEASPEPFDFGRQTLWRARIAAQRGDASRALELLRQACADGMPYGLDIHTDPDLEPLRGHPSYEDFLRPKG